MSKIIQATVNDLPALVKWRVDVLCEVFRLSPDRDMTELAGANYDYYSRALQSGAHVACFAEESGKVVGCGGICFQEELPSPDNPSGKCAYLMNIYVCPQYRHGGIGEEIVRWLTRKARDLKITKIYLESTDKAKALYSSIGYREMFDYMLYDIDAE